jgi:iron-sulfur cluster repair protein YtfE (RIC family)
MATPTMSMNKTIHCAVRRDLRRFRDALGAFRDGDRSRAEALHRAWQNFDAQLTDHHEGEHEIAWPAMRAIGISDASLASFDTEHEAMARELANTRAAMDKLAGSATRADADAAAAALAKLDQATTSHLEHEETLTEPALAEHEGHAAMKEMGRKFSRRSGPAKAGNFFAWMEDGATAQEKAALRQSVPRPVLAIMGGLFGRTYRKQIAPVWRS